MSEENTKVPFPHEVKNDVPIVTPDIAQGILQLLTRITLSPNEINSYMLIQHTLQQIAESADG